MVNSRAKGHNFERTIARDFRSIGFEDAERTQEGSSKDRNAIDFERTGCWDVQAKVGRKYAPVNVIEEIKGDGMPLLITKADRKDPMVVLKWSDFRKY